MTDTIKLELPRDPRYYGIARVVIGGLAAGIEFSYDALDDLQLAIGSLLDNRDLSGPDIVAVELTATSAQVVARLGPFTAGSLDQAFDASRRAGGDMDLERLLETVVDGVESASDGDGDWITLTKRAVATV